MQSFSAKLCTRVALAACVYLTPGCGASSSNLYDPPSGGDATSGGDAARGGDPASGGDAASGGNASSAGDAPSAGSPGATGGSGPTSGGGGTSPAAGTSGTGTFGGAASAGTGGTGAAGDPSNAACSPAQEVTGVSSGEFGTTGPVCFRVTTDIAGWGCSNFDGRTVKVNGRTVMCAEVPLPDKIDGAYYFDISAGTFKYASFYWF
jgi:endoglucanase